jgi:Bacterial nucleoid DNA-binding protein
MDNKTFISRLAKRLNREQGQVAALTDGLLTAFREAATSLDSIAIPGFGTFKTEKTDEQISTDAVTGRRMLLPPKIEMTFRPSVVLRKKMKS